MASPAASSPVAEEHAVGPPDQQRAAVPALEVPVAGVSGLRLLDASFQHTSLLSLNQSSQWATAVIAERGGSRDTVREVARWLSTRNRAFEARFAQLVKWAPLQSCLDESLGLMHAHCA